MDEQSKLGVDLSDPRQKGLIDRIFWARFSGQVRATGYDPEDGLQDVYRGILARNQGKNPWDPRISSLSNYVYIVVQSICRNIADSQKRARRRGWRVGGEEDVASWDHGASSLQAANGLTWEGIARAKGMTLEGLAREAGLVKDPDVFDLFG